MDSKLLGQAISSSLHHPCVNYDLIQAIDILVKRQWVVQIRHVYREGNITADHTANKGFSIEEHLVSYNNPPSTLRHVLANDVMGISFNV